jgi:hypothetical protein
MAYATVSKHSNLVKSLAGSPAMASTGRDKGRPERTNGLIWKRCKRWHILWNYYQHLDWDGRSNDCLWHRLPTKLRTCIKIHLNRRIVWRIWSLVEGNPPVCRYCKQRGTLMCPVIAQMQCYVFGDQDHTSGKFPNREKNCTESELIDQYRSVRLIQQDEIQTCHRKETLKLGSNLRR